MTRWTTTPTDGDARPANRLIRCRPSKPLTGIITSTLLTGCYVHYWRGRTTPCQDDQCEPCKERQIARWYGWLGLWNPTTHEHVIAEITASCLDTINAYMATHGQLRGGHLALARANDKQNSRLHALVKESNVNTSHIPPELDIITSMEKIWETHHSVRPTADSRRPPGGVGTSQEQFRTVG
jgi:hypothetical protein